MLKGLMLMAVIVAAMINAVACQDVEFRTKETDEPAATAFLETANADMEETAAEVEEPIIGEPESKEAQTAIAPQAVFPTVAPVPASTTDEPQSTTTLPPAPAPAKYSIIGPDGVTYTGYSPMYIICRCGQPFSSGAEWQAHFDGYNAWHCSCGAIFGGIGEWETHAGIYDPATYLYTGKSDAEAAAEGHTLINRDGHTPDVNAHGSWRTS